VSPASPTAAQSREAVTNVHTGVREDVQASYLEIQSAREESLQRRKAALRDEVAPLRAA
jgi:hypothetical protein